MATKIGSVVIDIEARMTKLEADLAKANRTLGRFDKDARSVGSRIEGSFKKIAATAITMAGAFAATGILSFARQSLDATGGLGELAQQLGVTTDQLQVYQYAATQAGLKNEELQTSLGQLSRRLGQASLGVKAPAEAFKILGVEVKNADGTIRRTGQVLPDIAEALSKIESPAQRAALATELFGRSGQKLLPILESGRKGLNEYEQAARSLGVVLSSEQIAKADEAADKLAALNLVLSQRFAGVVADNAGAVLTFAGAIEKLSAQVQGYLNIAQSRGGLAAIFATTEQLSNAGTRAGTVNALEANVRGAQQRLRSIQNSDSPFRSMREGRAQKDLQDARDELAKYLRENPIPLAVVPTVSDGALGGTTLGDVFGTAGKDKAVKGLFDDFKSPDVDEFFRKQEEASRRVAELFAETESIIVTGVDNKSRKLVRSLEEITAELEGPSNRAFEEWTAKREEEIERLNNFATEFAATFSGAFEDALLSGDLDGALDGLLEDLARLVIRLTIIEPLAKSVASALGGSGGGGFGGFISSIGSIFGGGRALGGPVTGGTSYLVGERGPETFTPKVDGYITPANDVSGGMRVEVVPSQYFDVRVQEISGGMVARAAPAIINGSVGAVRSGMRRNRRFLG